MSHECVNHRSSLVPRLTIFVSPIRIEERIHCNREPDGDVHILRYEDSATIILFVASEVITRFDIARTAVLAQAFSVWALVQEATGSILCACPVLPWSTG